MKKNILKCVLSLIVVFAMLLAGSMISDKTGSNISKATEVNEPAAVALKFTAKTKSLVAGKSKTFKVNLSGAAWSSSDTKVATVSSKGKVKAVKYGNTTIKATVGAQSVSVKLTVKPVAVIGIDPGHQERGDSSTEPVGPGSSQRKAKVAGGTRGVSTGKPEYKLTLEVGKKLKKELVARGYKVVMTRTKNDVNISNKERAQKLNKKCEVAVRLHADGAASSSARGASMQCHTANNPYISNLYKASNKLSKAILSAYTSATGLRSRGVAYRDDLTGTNWSTIPVTLIELGFMTNGTEDEFMSSKSGQKKMVKGIADGIDDYYGRLK